MSTKKIELINVRMDAKAMACGGKADIYTFGHKDMTKAERKKVASLLAEAIELIRNASFRNIGDHA